jgi:Na+/melibiose symporter-like transporter
MDFGQKTDFIDQTQILMAESKSFKPVDNRDISRGHGHLAQSSIESIQDQTSKSSAQNIKSTKIFVSVVAFIHGFYDLAGLSLLYYQKDIFKLDPQFIQLFGAMMLLPFGIKPVFGYLSDRMLNQIGKTKIIISTAALARTVIYLCMFSFDLNIVAFYFLLFFVNLCQLFENIMCEYILVVTTKIENSAGNGGQGNDLPIFFGFKSIGSLCGTFLGGRIIEKTSLKIPFLVTSIMPAAVLFASFLHKEKRREIDFNKRAFKEELAIVKGLVFRNEIKGMIILIFLISAAPSFDVLATFYLIDILNFTTSDLANLATFTTVCYLIGLICYTFLFKKVDPKRFYLSTNFVHLAIRSLFLLVIFKIIANLGLNEKFFCLLNFGASSFIAELNFMPILAIWCNVCPKNLEATAITLLTGILNLALGVSEYVGAFLCWVLGINKTNVEKIWLPLIIQCAYLLVGITAVLFVHFPSGDPNRKEDKEEQNIEAIELKSLSI